jgi:hypothetical protein
MLKKMPSAVSSESSHTTPAVESERPAAEAAGQGIAAHSCCDPSEQATCCQPQAKAECCGPTTEEDSCGCR